MLTWSQVRQSSGVVVSLVASGAAANSSTSCSGVSIINDMSAGASSCPFKAALPGVLKPAGHDTHKPFHPSVGVSWATEGDAERAALTHGLSSGTDKDTGSSKGAAQGTPRWSKSKVAPEDVDAAGDAYSPPPSARVLSGQSAGGQEDEGGMACLVGEEHPGKKKASVSSSGSRSTEATLHRVLRSDAKVCVALDGTPPERAPSVLSYSHTNCSCWATQCRSWPKRTAHEPTLCCGIVRCRPWSGHWCSCDAQFWPLPCR